MSDLLKKWAIRSFAHFWWETWALRSRLLIPTEQPEQIVHRRSFDLSDSLTVLRRNERIFCLLKTSKKTVKNVPKYDFFEFFWANCSFFVSKKINERLLKKPSNSLICPEQPQQIAHISSYVMSDLSDSLTVAHLSWPTWVNATFAHLSWAIWANERWANVRIPNPGILYWNLKNFLAFPFPTVYWVL